MRTLRADSGERETELKWSGLPVRTENERREREQAVLECSVTA